MELALLLGLIFVSLLIFIIHRDIKILSEILVKGESDSVIVTPIIKTLATSIKAISNLPDLLAGTGKSNFHSLKIKSEVLKDVAEELKNLTNYECLLCSGQNLGSTDHRLTSAFLGFKDFIFESKDSLRFPLYCEANSMAAFGILTTLGFKYIHIDQIEGISQGFAIFGSVQPIDTLKLRQAVSFLGRELALWQKIDNIKIELDELSKKSSILRRKLSAVAHDAKSPVQTLNLILSQCKNSSSEDLLELGKFSIQFLDDLIAQFKDGSDDNDEVSEFDVADVVRETQSMLTPILAFKGKNLLVEIQPKFRAKANRTEFKRIILNLISNSIKYGRGDLRISSCDQPGKKSLIFDDYSSDFDIRELEGLNKQRLLDLEANNFKFASVNGWGFGLTNIAVLCDKNNLDITFSINENNGLRVEVFWLT
ncbi:MAG: hypothetical protein NZO16_04675 [Deltaproteobacteria bacterium]|nr:hypothetical protein [Deltaproteobacteria bacterium]